MEAVRFTTNIIARQNVPYDRNYILLCSKKLGMPRRDATSSQLSAKPNFAECEIANANWRNWLLFGDSCRDRI